MVRVPVIRVAVVGVSVIRGAVVGVSDQGCSGWGV